MVVAQNKAAGLMPSVALLFSDLKLAQIAAVIKLLFVDPY